MRWLALRIGGQRWSVYLVPAKSKKLHRGACHGICDYTNCKIYINKSLGEGAREDTLLHELLHATLFISGASAVYKDDSKLDEALVTALTPMLHRLLCDLGFRFPARL